MIQIFMKSPAANSLAVLVLIALVATWLISIVLTMSSAPVQTEKGWYAKLLPGFSLLGIPAAFDLFQTEGEVVLIVATVLMIFILNLVVPLLKIYGKSSNPVIRDWYKWSILITTIGGLIVAGYLVFVHTTKIEVACGHSGGCETVQNSSYAVLFGVHVSTIGLIGYIGILLGWLVWQFGPRTIQRIAPLLIWAMCFFGVLFSTYLTFLEPFVLGETCMWCIFSAVLMILLLVASTPSAQQVFTVAEE